MKRLILVVLFIGVGAAYPVQNQRTTTPNISPVSGANNSPVFVEIKKQPKTDAEKAEDTKREKRAVSTNKWTIGLTAALVCAAFIQSLVLFGQWVAYMRSTRAQMNVERAWISVWPAVWTPELHPLWETGDPPPADPQFMNPFVHAFTALIKNTGKTPAHIQEVKIKYVLSDQGPSTMEANPVIDRLGEPPFTLVPGDETSVQALLSPDPILTKDQVFAIRSQRAFLFAFGLVTYLDVFDQPRETRFGFVYNFPQGGMINFQRNAFKIGGPESYNRLTWHRAQYNQRGRASPGLSQLPQPPQLATTRKSLASEATCSLQHCTLTSEPPTVRSGPGSHLRLRSLYSTGE